jgi:hypothetical protein
MVPRPGEPVRADALSVAGRRLRARANNRSIEDAEPSHQPGDDAGGDREHDQDRDPHDE